MGDQGEAEAEGGDGFTYAPETKANAIPFQEMCDVLEKMRFKTKVNDKLELLEPFLSKVGRESAFPFMRLILPEYDNLRDKYGVKTMKLAKLVAQMYFPDKTSKQFQQLVLHTDPVKNPSPAKEWQITGDFPLTLQYILQHSPSLHVVERTTWTLGQVNKTLDDLAKAGSDAARAEVLRRIRVECSPVNQKWIMRIILKNLKIKLKKDSVLKKVHPDALDEYSRTTSLRKVCSTFIGLHNSVRLKSNIEVFTSFSPMLAANLFYNMRKIIPSMMGRPFCMDVKLDGERILCHREGTKIKWFTRNAKDFSEMYGPVLDPHILEGVSTHKCILDGEVVTWDDDTGSMVPFGHNRRYAREEAEGHGSGTRWLFYVVFDIVYAAGEGPEGEECMNDILRDAASKSRAPCAPGTVLKGGNLTALPLDIRRRVLRSVMTEKEHRLEFVKSKDVEAGDEAKREEQLSTFFELNAFQLGEEGLVVKTLDGHYEIGEKSRKKCLWVKMKPEYSDETADMDLIILGAGFAQGRMRSGLLSKFLVGVSVPSADVSPPTQFYPITRVSTGFTMEELEELNKRLQGKWKTFDTKPPHFPVRDSTRKSLTGRDGVQISRWIAPEDSICLEVKSMEIQKSSDWAVLGCTLRFPRVMRIRFDKGAEGCLDTTQLAEMQASPRHAASIVRGGYGGSNINGTDGKFRRRHDGRGRKKGGGLNVSGVFATGGGDGVTVKEDVFVINGKPLEMCVIGTRFVRVKTPVVREKTIDVDAWWDGSAGSKRKAVDGSEFLGRSQMGDLIREYGGIPTPHPQASTAFVIVGDNNVQVQHVIADGSYNVVDYRWLFECIDRTAYEFPSMHYLRAISPQIRNMLENYKDEYGDDFTTPIDAKELSQLLLNIRSPSQGNEGGDSTWLLPLDEVDAEDRAALMDGPEFLFADESRCLVYCDLYPDLGPADPPGKANRCGHGEPSTREESFHVLGSTAAAIRLYGGNVAPSLHVGVTHVVFDPNDATRHARIRDRIRDLHKRSETMFHIRLVKSEWVWRCIELGRLESPLDEHIITLA